MQIKHLVCNMMAIFLSGLAIFSCWACISTEVDCSLLLPDSAQKYCKSVRISLKINRIISIAKKNNDDIKHHD